MPDDKERKDNGDDDDDDASELQNVLSDFVELLSKPESLAISLLSKSYVSREGGATADATSTSTSVLRHKKVLQKTCQVLFRRIEGLSKLYGQLLQNEALQHNPLSGGLDQLYMGPEADNDDEKEEDDGGGGDMVVVDAEMLFEQVDLQNRSLLQKVLKKATKKLSKAAAATGNAEAIRVLGDVSDSEDNDDDDDDDGDDNSDENDVKDRNLKGEDKKIHSDDSNSDNEEDDDDQDEETRRIRARMERAMEDMDEDENDDDGNMEAPSARKTNKKDMDDEEGEESLVDPAAEELNDGFFDINEMEAFADEEEEYLPDEAMGPVRPEDDKDAKKDKKKQPSFHQKQRDGNVDSGGSEEEEDDDDDEKDGGLLFRMEPSARRRRYREDDEIDALYSLYQEPKLNDFDNDDDGDDDVIHMTAADIFGKPQKKYYDQHNKSNKTPRQGRPKKADGGGGDDDDSWEDYDFERSNNERATGWNDPFEDEDMPNGQDDYDEDDDEEDENVPMKGRRRGSGGNSGNKAAAATSSSSAHARQAEKLRQQTEQLEKDMLAEKPWQMTGETTSTARPVDSLLSTTPEFEVASKPTPVITVEKTASLEETIKKRILNEDWDDVIPRELPDVGWESKRGELPEVSQEKSKLGLGELYEREYLKKAVGYDVTAAEKETQEEKAKNEMKSLFANLCSKLDALSNYHFAPRPIADEAEVRPVTKPAIAMEEVLPLHVSDARAVAPEEVYNSKRGREGVLRGESEHDQQDRKRLRASKKSARRKRRQEKLADEKLISKLQPAGVGLDNPYEKRKIRQELAEARARGQVTTGEVDANNTDYGTSGTFFQRMQEEARQSIRGEDGEALKISAKKKADNRNQKSSSSLKL